MLTKLDKKLLRKGTHIMGDIDINNFNYELHPLLDIPIALIADELYHHGIITKDDPNNPKNVRVAHFADLELKSNPYSKARFIETDLATFLQGRELIIIRSHDKRNIFTADQIMRNVEILIERNLSYDLKDYNCEHAVINCLYPKPETVTKQ